MSISQQTVELLTIATGTGIIWLSMYVEKDAIAQSMLVIMGIALVVVPIANLMRNKT